MLDIKTHWKGKGVKMDGKSEMHFRVVRAEIEGRFFSLEEANRLKEAIDDRTIIDPAMRELAAKAWEK